MNIQNKIKRLEADIELWERRKVNAVQAYDTKIAEIRAIIEGYKRGETFLSRDASRGASLMRPHSEAAGAALGIAA